MSCLTNIKQQEQPPEEVVQGLPFAKNPPVVAVAQHLYGTKSKYAMCTLFDTFNGPPEPLV